MLKNNDDKKIFDNDIFVDGNNELTVLGGLICAFFAIDFMQDFFRDLFSEDLKNEKTNKNN